MLPAVRLAAALVALVATTPVAAALTALTLPVVLSLVMSSVTGPGASGLGP
jgi:hypothetical protein